MVKLRSTMHLFIKFPPLRQQLASKASWKVEDRLCSRRLLKLTLSISSNFLHRQSPPPFSLGVNLVKTEGAAALFSGVSATLLRQTLYSTTRMGLYEVLKNKW
ncbi:unnamed protein product [Brassica napus]|uniref:(rape) hypothetical protein n=1 Tax=Brassica napus TaxID=3708 RepID=A0A816W6U9_BRANA|nr:unnamed protein product [Brassica napus]